MMRSCDATAEGGAFPPNQVKWVAGGSEYRVGESLARSGNHSSPTKTNLSDRSHAKTAPSRHGTPSLV
jgi:hypothetical protein